MVTDLVPELRGQSQCLRRCGTPRAVEAPPPIVPVLGIHPSQPPCWTCPECQGGPWISVYGQWGQWMLIEAVCLKLHYWAWDHYSGMPVIKLGYRMGRDRHPIRSHQMLGKTTETWQTLTRRQTLMRSRDREDGRPHVEISIRRTTRTPEQQVAVAEGVW